MPNCDTTFNITSNDFVFQIAREELSDVDLIQKSATEFNCIREHRSVNVILLEADTALKKFKLSIEGEIFSVEIKDELDQLIEKMGLGSKTNKQLVNIKAPMPGLVLDIAVTDGQQLNAGDKILILEAMKMENSIVLPAAATIKKILVKKGQAVERGQVLVELEAPSNSPEGGK